MSAWGGRNKKKKKAEEFFFFFPFLVFDWCWEAREKCLTEPLTSFRGNSRIDDSMNLPNSCWRITRKRYQQRPLAHPLPPPPPPPPLPLHARTLSVTFKSKATESHQNSSLSTANPQLYRSSSRVMENHTPNSTHSHSKSNRNSNNISQPSAIGWPRRKPNVPPPRRT